MMMMFRQATGQQVLPFATAAASTPAKPAKRSKRRAKPGRKPRAERIGFQPHVTRPGHHPREPVLVTARCVANVPSLRSELVLAVVAAQIRAAIRRGIGVVHYSIQDNHLHLLVEANDKTSLARGMQWLFAHVALEVNRLTRRSGRLFRDRHHRMALSSPTQTRRALAYVLLNGRKHRLQKGDHISHLLHWVDPGSSAAWFDGWNDHYAPPRDLLARTRAGPCSRPAPPRTWLAREGWLLGGGPIRFDEMLRR